MDLKFLVTGTGRCGTVYMARLLTSLGIPCGHESVFTPNGYKHAVKVLNNETEPILSNCSLHDISTDEELRLWVDPKSITAEASYMAVPYLNYKAIQDVPVIHVVRNPMKVVNSFVFGLNYFFEMEYEKIVDEYQFFIYSYLPNLCNSTSQMERACIYYIKWNQMIEAAATDRKYIRHKVEDGFTKDLADFLGVEHRDVEKEENVNSLKVKQYFKKEMILNELVRDKTLQMAERYGYEIL